jgi:hypothetical protein
VKPHTRTRIGLGWWLWLVTRREGRGLPGGGPAAHDRRGADAAFLLVFLLGYATIGAGGTLRRPANPTGCRGRTHDGRQVTVVSSANLEGGHVRRAIQVLSISLMAAGLLLDTSLRNRNRRANRTSDKDRTSRLPLLLFWIGAVLLVLSSI